MAGFIIPRPLSHRTIRSRRATRAAFGMTRSKQRANFVSQQHTHFIVGVHVSPMPPIPGIVVRGESMAENEHELPITAQRGRNENSLVGSAAQVLIARPSFVQCIVFDVSLSPHVCACTGILYATNERRNTWLDQWIRGAATQGNQGRRGRRCMLSGPPPSQSTFPQPNSFFSSHRVNWKLTHTCLPTPADFFCV